MKINYNQQMKDIISNLKTRPKLALHSCCAPCSSAVIERLSDNFDITVVYYNPNIFPEEEYLKRKDEQQKFIEKLRQQGSKINFAELEYDYKNFEETVKDCSDSPEGGARCFKCYKLRLNRVANYALLKGYDYFCSTLSVSPYKNTQYINQIGFELEKKIQVKFLPNDFKKENGYLRSIKLSKQNNFYRQDFCGCKYSLRNKILE